MRFLIKVSDLIIHHRYQPVSQSYEHLLTNYHSVALERRRLGNRYTKNVYHTSLDQHFSYKVLLRTVFVVNSF